MEAEAGEEESNIQQQPEQHVEAIMVVNIFP